MRMYNCVDSLLGQGFSKIHSEKTASGHTKHARVADPRLVFIVALLRSLFRNQKRSGTIQPGLDSFSIEPSKCRWFGFVWFSVKGEMAAHCHHRWCCFVCSSFCVCERTPPNFPSTISTYFSPMRVRGNFVAAALPLLPTTDDSRVQMLHTFAFSLSTSFSPWPLSPLSLLLDYRN